MAYSSTTERLITLKKISGKAHTSNDKGLANEGLPSGVTLSTETIFSEAIPKSPTSNALYDTTGKVELVRFPTTFINGTDTSDGRHGFELKLPSDYESNSSNPKAGTYPYVNDQSINITSGALQLVPTSFSNNYEAKPFYGGSATKDSGTQIPILDARDWNLDYFNGVFFQQDPPGTGDHSNNPDFVEAYLYIGNYLSTGGATSGHVEITGSLGVKGNTVFDGNVGVSGSLLDKNGNELLVGSIQRFITNVATTTTRNTAITFSGLTLPTATTDGVIDLYFNGALLHSGSEANCMAGTADYYLFGSDGVKLGFDSEDDDTLILKHNSVVLSSGGSGGSSAIDSVSNGADNRIATFSSSTALNGESLLTFDGSTFTCNASAVFNEAGGSSSDFRVESQNEQRAIDLDASTNTLFINGGESSFTTKIANDNDIVILVDDTGVVFNEDGHANVDFRVESTSKPHAFYVDSSRDQVLVLSGGHASSSDSTAAADVNFYVSGSTNSKDTTVRGTSVFGGDVAISGSLLTKTHVWWKNFVITAAPAVNIEMYGKWHDGLFQNTGIHDNFHDNIYWLPVIHSGSIRAVTSFGGTGGSDAADDDNMAFMMYKYQNMLASRHSSPNTSNVPNGVVTGSIFPYDTDGADGSRGISKFLMYKNIPEVSGSFNFNPGDAIAIAVKGVGTADHFGYRSFQVEFEYNMVDESPHQPPKRPPAS